MYCIRSLPKFPNNRLLSSSGREVTMVTMYQSTRHHVPAGSNSHHEKFKRRINNSCLENFILVLIGVMQQVIYIRSYLTPSIFSKAGQSIKIVNIKYSIRINKICFKFLLKRRIY
jgi:hypothetical protein